MQPPAEARDHARPARQMLSSAYSGRSLRRPQQGCVRAAAGPPQATLVRGIRGQDEDVRRTRDPAPQRRTSGHACPRHAAHIPVRPYAGTRARYAFRPRRSAHECGGVQPPAQRTSIMFPPDHDPSAHSCDASRSSTLTHPCRCSSSRPLLVASAPQAVDSRARLRTPPPALSPCRPRSAHRAGPRRCRHAAGW